MDNRRDRLIAMIAMWTAFTLFFCGMFIWAAHRSQAQVRYEYKVHPEGAPGPILIPCIVIDRFNFVCIESTGEIFVDVAGWERTPAQSLPDMGLGTTRFRGGQPQVAVAATLSVIPPHRKIAIYGSPYRRGLYASPYRDVAGNQPALPLREPVPSVANASGSDAFAGRALLARTVFTAMRRSAATPRIILAHQKLARDGWVDRSYNKKGERCCDAGKDCFSLDPERVKPAPGGVNVTLDNGEVIFVPGNEILPSEDGKIWSCFWGERLRCLFMPYNGS